MVYIVIVSIHIIVYKEYTDKYLAAKVCILKTIRYFFKLLSSAHAHLSLVLILFSIYETIKEVVPIIMIFCK